MVGSFQNQPVSLHGYDQRSDDFFEFLKQKCHLFVMFFFFVNPNQRFTT